MLQAQSQGASATSATLSRRVEAALVGVPLASSASLVFGVAKREEPQSKQTETFGNTQPANYEGDLS